MGEEAAQAVFAGHKTAPAGHVSGANLAGKSQQTVVGGPAGRLTCPEAET